MILKVSLDLPGDGTYLRIARRIGHTLLEDLGVVDQDIADIEFIVGELCTNVVRHAQTTVDSRFLVALEYHADRVAIIVEDKGVGFSSQDIRDVGATRPDRMGPTALAALACNWSGRWPTTSRSSPRTRTGQRCSPRRRCTTRRARTPAMPQNWIKQTAARSKFLPARPASSAPCAAAARRAMSAAPRRSHKKPCHLTRTSASVSRNSPALM